MVVTDSLFKGTRVHSSVDNCVQKNIKQEVHDPDGFTTATFIYTDNLTEIIDDVEYCVGDGAGANGDPHIVRWKQTKRDR